MAGMEIKSCVKAPARVFVTIFLGFLLHMARRTGSLYGWLLVGSAMRNERNPAQ
jgi:hypothetical protein